MHLLYASTYYRVSCTKRREQEMWLAKVEKLKMEYNVNCSTMFSVSSLTEHTEPQRNIRRMCFFLFVFFFCFIFSLINYHRKWTQGMLVLPINRMHTIKMIAAIDLFKQLISNAEIMILASKLLPPFSSITLSWSMVRFHAANMAAQIESKLNKVNKVADEEDRRLKSNRTGSTELIIDNLSIIFKCFHKIDA